MKRFSPRFSVRTLAIFVTLVCAYFGAWEATKRHVPGNDWDYQGADKPSWVAFADSPMPFIIRQHESNATSVYPQRYYLWFFGPKFKLPFESTWTLGPPDPPDPDNPFATPAGPAPTAQRQMHPFGWLNKEIPAEQDDPFNKPSYGYGDLPAEQEDPFK